MATRDYSRVLTLGEVARAVGVAEWRIRNYVTGSDYGPIQPSIARGKGKGSRRLFDVLDAYKLAFANKLYEDGFRPDTIRYLVAELFEVGGAIFLMFGGLKAKDRADMLQVFHAGRRLDRMANWLVLVFPSGPLKVKKPPRGYSVADSELGQEFFISVSSKLDLPSTVADITNPEGKSPFYKTLARMGYSLDWFNMYTVALDELFESVDRRLFDQRTPPKRKGVRKRK